MSDLSASASNTAPTFTVGNGYVTTNLGRFPVVHDFATGVAFQSGGRIVVAGYSWGGEGYLALARYTSDGRLDTSFDGDGKAFLRLGSLSGDTYATDIAISSDDRIVLAAYNDISAYAIRYHANGGLDYGFGNQGLAYVGGRQAAAVVVQPDAKIVVGTADYRLFGIARLNPDGSLDTSFAGDGTLREAPLQDPTEYHQLDDVMVQPDGRIIAIGSAGGTRNDGTGPHAYRELLMERYNADGSLDTSFGANGKVYGRYGDTDSEFSGVLQPDGKLIVAGDVLLPGGGSAMIVLRYNSDGSPDLAFGSAGTGARTLSFGGSHERSYAVALQPDGKIVVLGDSSSAGGSDSLAIARLNADGSLDTTFDGDGKLTPDLGSGNEVGRDVHVLPDGRIFAVGVAGTAQDNDFLLLRLNGDGSLDSTFGAANTLGGRITVDGGTPAVLDADVRVRDAELAALGNYGGASVTLVRHGGASAEDVFAASGALGALTEGAALTYSGVTVGAVERNSAGTLVLAFNAAATQARVDAVLSSIAYANSSSTPPASVQIDWNFSDGNSGAQGSGGALGAFGATTVAINAANHAPTIVSSGGGASASASIAENTSAVTTVAATDPEPLPVLTYSIAGGADASFFSIDPATGVLRFVAAPDFESAQDHGANNVYDVIVRARDGAGAEDTQALAVRVRNVSGGVFTGSELANTLVGGTEEDTLNGLGGDDVLQGKGGNDTMSGGPGDDKYVVDSAADRTVEQPGEGFDRVETALAAYTLQPNVEVLIYSGSAAFRGAGNAGANFIYGGPEDDRLSGGDGDDYLNGGVLGDDVMTGDAGNDWLSAGAGNDVLIGGAGMDGMSGGGGDDRYVVDAIGDRTFERPGEGYDTVETALASYALESDVEALIYSGGAAFSGTGNALANQLYGGDGADVLSGGDGDDYLNGGLLGSDVLIGGRGADTLRGGGGSDRFDFDDVGEGVDRILDLQTGAGGDRIDISDVLVGYDAGSSDLARFVRLTGGTDAFLEVNADGIGSDFVRLVRLQGIANTASLLNDLIADANLIIA